MTKLSASEKLKRIGRVLKLRIMQRQDLRRPVTILEADGPFRFVGRRSFHWTDVARVDVLRDEPEAARELLVWVWYPADSHTCSARAPYLPEPWLTGLTAIGEGDHLRFRTITGNSFESPKAAQTDQRLPVLVFCPGLQALPTDYSGLMEDLASHGYVVFGICGPCTPSLVIYPDGQEIAGTAAGQCGHRDEEELRCRKRALLSVWTADMQFVIDRILELSLESDWFLSSLINRASVGVFGHSFGGTTAFKVAVDDERAIAAICMDGWFDEVDGDLDRHVDSPCLYLTTGCATSGKHLGHFSEGWQATVNGFRHISFGDGPLLVSERIREYVSRVVGSENNVLGAIDGERSMQITRHCVRAFFDMALKSGNSIHEWDDSRFSEVTITRLPE